MSEITITEALAELKLIKAKIEKKKQFIGNFIARQDAVKDPLEKQGGSVNAIRAERQSINDLLGRFVNIRSKIALANASANLAIAEETKSVAEWIVWRRDISPIIKDLHGYMAKEIANLRNEGRKRGVNVVHEGQATTPNDIIVNIDEKELAEWSEKTAEILGVLDGRLSLHNATVKIDV